MEINASTVSGQGFQPGPMILKGGYTIQLISTLEQWRGMARTWNDLLIKSKSNTIFLTWEWLFAWAKCFLGHRRKLFLLYIYHDQRLIGIAPFYLQNTKRGLFTLRELRLLGSPETGSDYLDVIIKQGREKAVADMLYEYLFSSARRFWDELCLTDIPTDSLFLLYFMNKVEAHGRFSETQRCAVMPQTYLPGTTETFLNMLSSKRRSRFRQDMRRLAQEGNAQHISYDKSDLDEGLERFFKLYNTKSGYDGSNQSSFLSMLKSIQGDKQLIHIDILHINNNDIAGLLHLRYDHKQFLLLMVVDKNFNRKISTGNVFVGMCIQQAIEDGMQNYDFLKGDEDYKFHWASDMRTSLRITINQRHPRVILSTVGRLLKYAFKVMLR